MCCSYVRSCCCFRLIVGLVYVAAFSFTKRRAKGAHTDSPTTTNEFQWLLKVRSPAGAARRKQNNSRQILKKTSIQQVRKFMLFIAFWLFFAPPRRAPARRRGALTINSFIDLWPSTLLYIFKHLLFYISLNIYSLIYMGGGWGGDIPRSISPFGGDIVISWMS